jgi:hypothetical protein
VASNSSVIETFNISSYINDQLQPEIAFNNSNYLVTWDDRRNTGGQIYYSRVTPSGTVLNDTGVRLSGIDSSDYYASPAVAASGNQYLIAWRGIRLSGDIILASRIDNAGVIIDTTPIELSGDTMYANQIAMAGCENNYLVTWTSEVPDTTGLGLYFKRISPQGEILDSAPRMIAWHYFGIYEQAVAYGGGCYLVVWGNNDDVYGCRILADGTVLDSGGFAICAESQQQIDPAVASDGHRFLVTWTDSRSGDYDIYGVFIDSLANVGIEENNLAVTNINIPVDISPIPFKDKVNIRFNIPGQNNIDIRIYNASGRLVNTLNVNAVSGQRLAVSNITWDGKDNHGKILPAGIYFCRISTGLVSVTKRIVKLKN